MRPLVLVAALLFAVPSAADVLVDLRPTPTLSIVEGKVEVRVDQRLHVGIGGDFTLYGTAFGCVIGTDYYTLRLRTSQNDRPPKQGFWAMQFECENIRMYAGQQAIYSRVFMVSGGGHWVDFMEFESRLGTTVLWNAPDKEGLVPVARTKVEGTIYAGRRFGPVTIRLGVTQTNPIDWRAGFALSF